MNNENYEVVLKLFDQVKLSADKTDKAVDNLSQAIKELINSNSISNDDLLKILNKMRDNLSNKDMEALKYKSALDGLIEHVNQIDANIIETKQGISKILRHLNGTIAIICVAFALMTISYLFVRNSVQDMIDRRLHSEERIEETDDYTQGIYEMLRDMRKNNEATEASE